MLEKISHGEWVAQVVPVPKADGSIKTCGDYKVTINFVLQVDQFTMPQPKDLYATLAAYQEVPESASHQYIQGTLANNVNCQPFRVASSVTVTSY